MINNITLLTEGWVKLKKTPQGIEPTEDAGGISTLSCNADALHEKATKHFGHQLRQPDVKLFPQITFAHWGSSISFTETKLYDRVCVLPSICMGFDS
jgi:hypothetical protein